MMQRYQEFVDPFGTPTFDRPLPIHLPIINYYRQSTIVQVGNLSTHIQTVDMVERLQHLGWRRDQIIMIDQDAGVSGTKAIDERPGMSEAFSLIVEGKVGAVACQDEDRLFRDLTAIQYNIFLDACQKRDVWVLTPNMFYDFNHPQMGQLYVMLFRQKCEMAAEYITSFIKGRLNRARLTRMLQGRWGGGNTAPGYMVDDRKTLPNGTPNDMWRRYVPFAPAADVVLEWFRLFVERYAGNVHATREYILKYGPRLRLDYDVPEGYRIHYTARAYKNLPSFEAPGCPSSPGMVHLLTNAVYLGHWVVNGAVVIRDNHQPIVPEWLFMTAFNYLSATSLDGTPNPHYAPRIENARPTLEEHRNAERPLCSYVNARVRRRVI
jgi:DNA invertase Pin-like site-specific DNA recombinase